MTTTAPQESRTSGAGAFLGLYRLLLRQQLSTGRLVLAGVMSGLAILVAVLLARESSTEQLEEVVGFLWIFGLGLMVPIISLVLASSSLGHLVEDETLVYLWIRPNPRWMLAAAAWLASATIAIPATAIPLAVAGGIGSEGDATVIWAAGLSVTLGVIAYTGLFTFLGLLVRRSLIWGLVYVFIWEFFVARVGQGTARLSINTYAASVLANITDVELPLAERAATGAIIVPIAVALVAVALTTWRLNNANIA